MFSNVFTLCSSLHVRGRCEKQKYALPLRRIEPRSSGHPARNLVVIAADFSDQMNNTSRLCGNIKNRVNNIDRWEKPYHCLATSLHAILLYSVDWRIRFPEPEIRDSDQGERPANSTKQKETPQVFLRNLLMWNHEKLIRIFSYNMKWQEKKEKNCQNLNLLLIRASIFWFPWGPHNCKSGPGVSYKTLVTSSRIWSVTSQKTTIFTYIGIHKQKFCVILSSSLRGQNTVNLHVTSHFCQLRS
jgi:hypothetical protein